MVAVLEGQEWLVIAALGVVLFGAAWLPGFVRSLGRAGGELRKARRGAGQGAEREGVPVAPVRVEVAAAGVEVAAAGVQAASVGVGADAGVEAAAAGVAAVGVEMAGAGVEVPPADVGATGAGGGDGPDASGGAAVPVDPPGPLGGAEPGAAPAPMAPRAGLGARGEALTVVARTSEDAIGAAEVARTGQGGAVPGVGASAEGAAHVVAGRRPAVVVAGRSMIPVAEGAPGPEVPVGAGPDGGALEPVVPAPGEDAHAALWRRVDAATATVRARVPRRRRPG